MGEEVTAETPSPGVLKNANHAPTIPFHHVTPGGKLQKCLYAF